jgi:hypothetical protein
LAENLGEESIDMRVPNKMIKDNKVKDFLKSKGYKFIHFSSGVGATYYNHLADINFQSGINEVLAVFIKTTALRPFEKRLIGDDARERILYTFSKLAEINRIKGPKFIFAHFISPHPPYLFDDNGVPVPGASLNMRGPEVWGQKEDYLRQLIFINKKVKILVDTLLSKSSISPVIIFQADHGPASRLPDLYSSDWDQPAQSIVRERTGILNALYLPEGGKELLYDSISPVNTFRLIFNYYFNANYELLNDQCFHSSYRYPYKFVNVTPKAIN